MTTERIVALIDGANLYASTRALNFDIDYKLLLAELRRRGRLLRAIYYTAVVEDGDFHSVRPLVDWLDYNGFSVVTKPTKEFFDALGRRKIKGNMDVEIVLDAIELAPHVDNVFLFSGDGDFRALVESLQRRGVRVTVISTAVSQPPMVADDLRRQADEFIDLTDLMERIARSRETDARHMEMRGLATGSR